LKILLLLCVVPYIHQGYRIGVLVGMNQAAKYDDVIAAGRDVAMQIAAMKPLAVDADGAYRKK
jgi:elongation factor Ts